jgi:hypothetical protein
MGPSSTSDPASVAAPAASSADELGRAFVDALGRKQFGEISTLLDPEVDFRGLTPGRAWEASGPDAVIGEILTQWFEESDHIDEVISVDTDAFADRQHLRYQLRVSNPDGTFVVEQHAYFTERDGRVNWMRVLCSGFRPQ